MNATFPPAILDEADDNDGYSTSDSLLEMNKTGDLERRLHLIRSNVLIP